MNWLSWLPPKNSRVAATTGRMLIRLSGVTWSGSRIDMRSRTTRSMRSRPMRSLILDQLAHRLDAAVAQVVNVVGRPSPLLIWMMRLMTATRSSVGQEAHAAFRLARIQPQAAVELVAPDLAQVIAPL
jgi:hypothetical protein